RGIDPVADLEEALAAVFDLLLALVERHSGALVEASRARVRVEHPARHRSKAALGELFLRVREELPPVAAIPCAREQVDRVELARVAAGAVVTRRAARREADDSLRVLDVERSMDRRRLGEPLEPFLL